MLKIYYVMGLNERCMEFLSEWMEELMMNVNAENFKFICIYYLCMEKTNKNINDFEEKIIKIILSNKKIQSVHYLGLFKQISKKRMNDEKFQDSEKILMIIENLLEENNPEMFLAHINQLYAKFMLQKNEEAFDLVRDLIEKIDKGN